MSNKLAALKFTLTYPAPGGGTNSVPSTTISCPFLSQNEGTIDIPGATADAIEFPISFGAVGDGATLLCVFNNTPQDLILKLNSTALENVIPAASCSVIACGNVLGDTPLTAASVTTTDTVGADPVSVDYLVFGDPLIAP